MSERRSDRTEALFNQVVELAPEQRAAFLDAACAGDVALRAEVEGLLAYDPGPSRGPAGGGLLRSPVVRAPASDTPLFGGSGVVAGLAATVEGLAAQLPPRYKVRGEVGRGGMGLVLRGRDTEIDREIALKVLLEGHQERGDLRQRFLEEARISGRLQHPGVVPVYDLGQSADQRPYFTMKLIQGRTLAHLLAQRREPGEDRARLVGVFLQVCQTVAYAHAKGVIHRDLKPANVMVGAFGEVQVMDWGLAKVLSEANGGNEPLAGIAQQGAQAPPSPSATRPGQVMGTLAYMAPEQASGEVQRLNQRSDVFGLGATLCEILTGQPPYVGRDTAELHHQAVHADLAGACARLRDCGADAGLVRLALACLAPRSEDRPPNAQAVTDALTTHLESVQIRLRQAELAEAEARARAAEEAKRRRLTLALAGTVLLAVALGSGGVLWLQADRQARQARIASEANDALNQVTRLREQARSVPAKSAALLAQARAQAQRALALVQAGPADAALVAQVRQVQEQLGEEEKDRQFIAALEASRLAQGETLAGENRFAAERAVPLFREAFRAYGLPVGEGESAAAAARLRRRPPQVREEASAALEEWITQAAYSGNLVNEPHLDWLRALAADGPDEGGTREVRAASQEKDPGKKRAELERLAAAADVRHLPPRTLTRLANLLRAARSTDSAVQLLLRARRQYPADFWLNHDLGFALSEAKPPRWPEAVRYLTVAAALRPDSPGAHLNLGALLVRAGRVDEAIDCYRKALEVDPKYASAHTNLGIALIAKGRPDEAVDCLMEAIRLRPDYAEAHYNLGSALGQMRKADEAIAHLSAAVRLRPGYAQAHTNLGIALALKGRPDEAIACYRKAIDIEPTLAPAYYNLGVQLAARGAVGEAVTCYRKAIANDPKHAQAYTNLGVLLRARGKVDEAIACYRKAIDVEPTLAPAHTSLGVALASKGQFGEAIACFKKALASAPNDALARYNLGAALMDNGQLNEARDAFARAVKLFPGNHPLGAVAAQEVQNCQRLLAIEKRLPRLLRGEFQPISAAEGLDLAQLCRLKRQHAAATRFFASAAAADPTLAADLNAEHRSNASLSAAVAAAGKGEDAGRLGEVERARLRRQALDWLRADLTARQKALQSSAPGQAAQARAVLVRWQSAPELAGLRDAAALSKLPATEQQAWRSFWADVRNVLTGSTGASPKP